MINDNVFSSLNDGTIAGNKFNSKRLINDKDSNSISGKILLLVLISSNKMCSIV